MLIAVSRKHRVLWLDDARRNLWYSRRVLRRTPGFAAVAVLTLALGIGANTSLFSAPSGVLLKALPYPAPDRIVTLDQNVPSSGYDGLGLSKPQPAAALVAAPRWTIEASGVTASLRGVSAVSESVVWACGSNGTVLRTEDGGLVWHPLTVTADPIYFRDVDAIDARTAYVLSIGPGPLSRIYKTSDAGATWALQFTKGESTGDLDGMAFWDADHGLVVGDSIDGQFYVLETADGGRAWTRVPPDALPPALPNEGAFAASGTNIAVYGPRDAWIAAGGTPTARVFHTPDRGRTWSVAPAPLAASASAGIFSIAFRDALHGIVVGGDYLKEAEAVDNVAVTADGGRTWTLVRDRGLSGFRSVVAYVPVDPGAAIAVGPQGADLTTDDGRSWTPIEGPGFHAFAFAPKSRTGWGAGAHGAIGRLSLDASPLQVVRHARDDGIRSEEQRALDEDRARVVNRCCGATHLEGP
jgi:photosystem II stability/assembly factor-like uncharacterized protein